MDKISSNIMAYLIVMPLTIPHSYQDSVILAKDSQIDQWNRIENPEIDPHKFDQPIFFFSGTGIWTQGLKLARQALIIWAPPSAPQLIFF
jgi:hypothetical protein